MSSFKVLKSLYSDKWIESCPVRMDGGNILLDSDTGCIYLNLKFRNASEQILSEVYLSCSANDRTVSFQYLGRQIKPKETFGETYIIPVTARSANDIRNITVEQVSFTSGGTWNSHGEQAVDLVLQKKVELTLDNKLWPHFKEQINNLPMGAIKKEMIYMPCTEDSYWRCVCGQPNKLEEEQCRGCGLSKSQAFGLVDEKHLKHLHKVYLRKKKQEARQQKIIMFAVAGCCILLVTGLLEYNVWGPNRKYNKAEQLYEEGKYAEAHELYQEVKDVEHLSDNNIDAKIRNCRERELKIAEQEALAQLMEEYESYNLAEKISVFRQVTGMSGPCRVDEAIRIRDFVLAELEADSENINAQEISKALSVIRRGTTSEAATGYLNHAVIATYLQCGELGVGQQLYQAYKPTLTVDSINDIEQRIQSFEN